MRLLISTVAALLLTTVVATGPSRAAGGASDDAEIEARLAAGEIAGALELAERAIDRAVAAGDAPTAIADRLEALGGRFYETATGDGTRAATRLLERAVPLREAQGDPGAEALASLLHDLSSLYFDAGRYGKAEQAERRALAIRERVLPTRDPRTAISRRDLGIVLAFEGRLADAEAYLGPSVESLEAVSGEDPGEIAIGRNYLAELYRLQGRYAEAAAILERLVDAAVESGAAGSEQTPYYLNNLAGVYRDQGRFDEAETLLRRSLELRRAADQPNEGAIARALLNLAELARLQGKFEDADPLYREALELARRAFGDSSTELLEFLNQSAVLERERGRLAEAEPRLREALALAERGLGPDHPRTAQSRLDLAELLRARGDCAAAEEIYARALSTRERVLGPEHPDVAEVLTDRALCRANDPARRTAARADLDRALAILARTEAHPEAEVDALALRAELSHRTDPESSRRDLGAALRVVEAMRPHRGGGEEVRAEFFSRHADLYHRAVGWEIEAGHSDRALALAERGRARALLDQLAATHVGESRPSETENDRRLQRSRAELAEIRERLAFESTRADLPEDERRSAVLDLERRQDEATRAFRALYDEIRNESPAWRGAAPGDPVTAASIQRDVVPAGGLLLLYDVGAEGGLLFLVPRAPGSIETRRLRIEPGDAAALGVSAGPLTEPVLDRIVTGSSGVLRQLAAPRAATSRGIGGLTGRRELDTERLAALARTLVPGDLWPRVARASEVLVVPDGALFLLPFETLVVDPGSDAESSRFWLDGGPVVRYAPSATFVHELRARVTPRRAAGERDSALSVADPTFARGARALPPLPGTAAESRAVRLALESVADVTSLSGNRARESAVRRELPGKRWVHVATHGLVDQAGGEIFAALALAPPPADSPARGDDDGYLQLFEIYDLRLDCALAVLSACSSNTGRVVAGEGVFALSRGFLVAGARSVVASQWAVDDASTAELIGDLFRRVAEDDRAGRPIDAARALRDAKLHVRRLRPEWAHPFYWGPFAITGAGGPQPPTSRSHKSP